MKKRIILISGAQGSGKTTLANEIERRIYKTTYTPIRLKFADALYDLHKLIYDYLHDEYGVNKPDKPDGKLLQVLGTDWGRVKDPNFWVKITKNRLNKLESDQIAIIDDARFPNEINAVSRGKSVRIRLECDEETRKARAEKWREDTKHASETALDGQFEYFDIVADSKALTVEQIADLVLSRLYE